MADKLSLKKKIAVITGAAGGIGSVIIKRFIDEGAVVAAADISKSGFKGGCAFFTVDVRKPASVKKLISSVVSKYGRIDIFINTAGIQKPIGPLTATSDKDWINCVETNLIGTMLCCKYAAKTMMRRKKGKIINFSGGGATFPRPNFSAYASSKAAIVRLTETLAAELSGYGIDVNAVSPGSVNTRMLKEIVTAGKTRSGDDYQQVLSILKNGGDAPELSAELCAFLASSQSDGVTGRLFSAVWDKRKVMNLKFLKKHPELYTLTRLDGRRFGKLNKTRKEN